MHLEVLITCNLVLLVAAGQPARLAVAWGGRKSREARQQPLGHDALASHTLSLAHCSSGPSGGREDIVARLAATRGALGATMLQRALSLLFLALS